MDLERLKIERGGSPATPARRRRRGGGTLLALALVLAAAWVFRRPMLEALDRLRLPEVQVLKVSPTSSLAASAVSGTAANGYVVARHRAALSADTPGRIVAMNVQEGSVVSQGDIVARLYADEYEATLRRAEADLVAAESTRLRAAAQVEEARATLGQLESRADGAAAGVAEAEASLRLAEVVEERARRLADESIGTQEDLDRAQAEHARGRARMDGARAALEEATSSVATGRSALAVAEAAGAEAGARIAVLEAERDLARATLEKTYVRAPFDGVVVLKDAEVGEVVSPNSQGGNSRGSVVTMVDFASLEVQVEVPETSIAAVEIGAAANVYLDAFPDRLYTGKVLRVWPTANRQKATIEVRVGFDAPDELLRPEMGARVVFAPDEEQTRAARESQDGGKPRILVPSGALQRVDGRAGVFVLERDVARFRELRVGAESSGRVLIEEGLQSGERIVVDPPHSLADGDRVRWEEP